MRDHIAKVARQAGLTAKIKQKMLIPGQTQEDGEPAPGSVRPLHRADVHIIEPAGTEIWIDVRIHTAHVDQPIGRDLLREEHQKLMDNRDLTSTSSTKAWFRLFWNSTGEPPQGRRHCSNDSCTTGPRSLSDKAQPPTQPQSAKPAQSCGPPSPAKIAIAQFLG